MKRKKILKFFANLFNKPFVDIALYIAGIVAVLALSGAFSSNQTIIDTFLKILTSEDTLSLFFAGLFSLFLAKIISWFDKYMEESLKTEDDHQKIISQYKGHRLGLSAYENSFADKKGVFLALTHVRKSEKMDKPSKEKLTPEIYEEKLKKWKKEIKKRTHIKDKQSKEYSLQAKRVEDYLSGALCLSSLNVFANVAGDTEIRFIDSNKKHELSPFIISHADEILQAHKNSVKKNSDTVRLDDFDYKDNTLFLNTERSTYYHMLITNRCMDYKFANGMSIRDTYEYSDLISTLAKSGLGNQIGINGLVVTDDNYILIEKRGHKKITWKNKFAQSISLALKVKDLMLGDKETLESDPKTAQENLKKIIENTLLDNFGLTTEDYDSFSIKENLLGLARDLLEGGKPNLYFYVKTKCKAEALRKMIEENVKITNEDNEGKDKKDQKKVISTSKLDSDYYLVPFGDINIDFYYRMFLDRKVALKVHRKLHPRCSKFAEWWDKFKEKCGLTFNTTLVRECGEALLVTIAYLELRWDWYIKNKEKAKKDEK